MTPGQERALRELDRIQAVDPDALERLGAPREGGNFVNLDLSFRIGPVDSRPGGLQLLERETFTLSIPHDYPFANPQVQVAHDRFARFPHVVWTHWLCLYQSGLEWNPTDGLFGFFDRLTLWLSRAAVNDMDPVEGPLEPPHHATDPDSTPIVVRANAPVEPGQQWVGWADLAVRSGYLELNKWRGLLDGEEAPAEHLAALAVVLPTAMPMEFPQTGGELFAAFAAAGLDRALLMDLLTLAAHVSTEGQPSYLVMGFPMRRAADGTQRQHIAVWSTDAHYSSSLRLSIPKLGDPESLVTARAELAQSVYGVFEVTNISWNQVLEDRDEVLVRRDERTPAMHFRGKRVLILGCGALGSWAAEFIARAKPDCLDLLDNAIVKPGLLARQNFTQNDIGLNKAKALARRIKALVRGTSVTPLARDAHRFLLEDLERTSTYDLIIDCAASSILQMKLERDWQTLGPAVRRLFSFELDAAAQRCIAVSLNPTSTDGPWSAYVRLKYKLCSEEPRPQIAEAFYDPAVLGKLFQPEPGCSDPTFSGSAIDVSNIAAIALNVLASRMDQDGGPTGAAFTVPQGAGLRPTLDVFSLAPMVLAVAGSYRVLISQKALNQARAAVRQNARIRSPQHETGGLLWGYWDDAAQVILILDASGPPPDSRHDPGHFLCGTAGTQDEHRSRAASSREACKFTGFWHTHPNFPPEQSREDRLGMTMLVGQVGQKQRRAVMLIFGRVAGAPTMGIYVYESHSLGAATELLEVGATLIALDHPVV